MSDLHYFHPAWITPTDERLSVDLCVYGGTAAGVVAGYRAAALGLSVVVLNPGRHVGGLTTGGLGWTDSGRKHVIGGLSREVYRRIGAASGNDPDGDTPECWRFAPHAAQAAIDAMIDEASLDVRPCQCLSHASVRGGRIDAARMLGGLRVQARVWIDATYEGDLLAAAGVPYTVGREGNARYGETLNGVQVARSHHFSPARVSPFVVAGDPHSGLLPNIDPRNLEHWTGRGDHRVQAYCFRVCMTDDPALKIDWQRPERYDARDFELAVRWYAQEEKDPVSDTLLGNGRLRKFDVLEHRTPGGFRKTDTNNHGAVSSDFIGANHGWPEGDPVTREAIFQRHVAYQQGLYWTLANDERVPQRYRDAYGAWGLPRDEFTASGHWPPQLYVREARRMVSDHVLTEHDCMGAVTVDDPVGMGSYNMDSHNCARFVTAEGFVQNEGDVQRPPAGPYAISYRSVVPPTGSVGNLLVPVCLSASHIAYGSARMEPVFMLLGESCAYAAALALRDGTSVQDVPYRALRAQLDAAGQVQRATE